jgi:acetylornithine/N-succinyldiaminopimelate aminotransferase
MAEITGSNSPAHSGHSEKFCRENFWPLGQPWSFRASASPQIMEVILLESSLPSSSESQSWVDWAQRASHIHLDHYAGKRLPYVCVSASGLHQRFVRLEGPGAGSELDVMDASGGYASACLGAGHPDICKAAIHSLENDGYVTDEIASKIRSDLLISLFEKGGHWYDRFPASKYHVSGRNSGSEGVELALRLALETRWDARRACWHNDRRQRRLILAFEGAWHGWTSAGVSLLNRTYFRRGLVEDLAADPNSVQVVFLPFGEIAILEEFFQNNKENVLAVLVEPIQGDAGIVVPPKGFLRRLAELCRIHEALFIADEVLTFAKTGDFFALYDDVPVSSDITVIGKSLGFGVGPISMVIARRELTIRPIGGVATCDLRPFACAVVKAGIECLVRQDLLQRSRIVGEQLADELRALVRRFPRVFSHARGLGYLHGLELRKDAAAFARDLRLSILEHGALVEIMSGAGLRSHGLPYSFPAIRVAPPLIADDHDVQTITKSIWAGVEAFVSEAKMSA